MSSLIESNVPTAASSSRVIQLATRELAVVVVAAAPQLLAGVVEVLLQIEPQAALGPDGLVVQLDRAGLDRIEPGERAVDRVLVGAQPIHRRLELVALARDIDLAARV